MTILKSFCTFFLPVFVSFIEQSQQKWQQTLYGDDNSQMGLYQQQQYEQQLQLSKSSSSQVLYKKEQRQARLLDSSDENIGANITRLLNYIKNREGYDRRIRPDYKGAPIGISVSMFISDISSISEVNMDITLDFYFRQFWHDHRLDFDGYWDEELIIGGEFMREIWRPDTFFVNVSFYLQKIPTLLSALLLSKVNDL